MARRRKAVPRERPDTTGGGDAMEEVEPAVGESRPPGRGSAEVAANDGEAEAAAQPAKDIVFRGFPLPGDLREAVRTTRDRSGLTNRTFVAGAVDGCLPGLVRRLVDLGFGTADGPSRPVRLPFSRGAGTLDALRTASDQTGVPASQLLALCLSASAHAPAPKKGRRGRKTKSPSE